TYQQAREQICAESDKLKAEYHSFVKNKYSAKNSENSLLQRKNNSLVDDYNTLYEKKTRVTHQNYPKKNSNSY
ncbi:hypothetical protein, partial [Spiroplasma endosymbiont of Megaselia nigra]|uniref:hypothetical protein n=1 Tax=Spiroplasma endosymbiont of Megaselia nigra TaxID=2478537 RepID=UPI000FA1147C